MAKSDFEYSVDESVGYLVRSLHRAFNKILAKRIAHANLTTAQWFFLRALWERNAVSQRELSDMTGLTEPTTVAALRVMEKNGLVQRRRDPKDGRRVIVRLTREGRALKNSLLPLARGINELALQGMDPGDIEQLKRLLRQLRTRLEEAT